MNRAELTPALLTMPVLYACPLCRQAGIGGKPPLSLYGVAVCRGCAIGFQRRRTLACIVDGLLLWLCFRATVRTLWAMGLPLGAGLAPTPQQVQMCAAGAGWLLIAAARDGWRGQSPGKWLTGLRVVEQTSFQPIGIWQSLKRNLPILTPFFVPLAVLVLTPLIQVPDEAIVLTVLTWCAVIVIVGNQMIHGPRWGDGWADTRVIWLRYVYRPPFDPRGQYCVECGYNLHRNTSGVCPECGTAVERLGETDAPSTGHRESGKR